ANEVKKALAETVLLSDGRYGYVITEVEDANGPDKWKCHVCSRVITTERAMLMHLSHPIHMSRLRVPHHPPGNFKKIIKSKNDAFKKNNLSPRMEEQEEKGGNNNKKDGISSREELWSNTVRPGEPIPPGMEDMVESKCQIQESLDNYTGGPLIGIEYIVELVSSEEGVRKEEPKYICLLCEKKGDPRSVMVHLTSHNHALRYISCFFRTAGNVINLIPKTRENRKGVGMAVSKIAEQIEKHYGRLKPTLAVTETFSQQKYEILRQIDEKEHFRETPSTTFIQYCTPEKIKEYSKLAEDEIISSIKNRKPDDFDEINRGFDKNDAPKTFPQKKILDKARNVPIQDKFSGKLSFSIGKPERSLGRNKSSEHPNQQPIDDKDDDDEVIFVPSNNEPIEVRSMSSISSASEESRMIRHRSRSLVRSRSRSRSRGRGRMRSPLRRKGRSIERRRTPPYRRDRHRSRSSRSRSRQRYYREPMYMRGGRDDIDRLRIHPRLKRSLSREKDRDRLRYEARIRMERDRHRRSYSSERDRKRLSPHSKGRHDRLSPRHDKSPEMKKKKLQSDYKSKMESYRSKLHDLEVEMDNKLKYFRERPEKHPQYSEEWKNFWNRRYKEIQQSGKDPNSYDFKPEWIIFWDERMKQLHEEELNAKKEELKSLLPVEEKGPSSDLQDISPPTPESQKDVTVDDIKNTWKALTGSDIKAPPKQKSPSLERKSPVRRSPSPWELENRMAQPKSAKVKHPWDAAPPIVHCLRMLSVLEQQLGSLGPKALELLSKALAMEKSKNNESMTLLHDEEIHIFFETVKEKIRGQLIAGIVVRYLVNSCRSVINTIESMLAAYPAKPKQPVPPTPAVVPPAIIQPEPVKVAGVGMVNKMAVAQQIAEILVAQGRTDVSQQELEELINAVVGIASSSNANVNQSSTAFISQLNIQNSTATSHINELLGNLIASAQKNLGPPSVVPVENIPLEAVDAVTLSQFPTSFVQFPSTTSSILNIPSASKLLDTVTNTKIEPLIKSISAPSNKSDTVPEKVIEKDSGNSVSDEDLKERLIKFKSLSRDEQQNLIALLKDLESKDPQRVEKLRQYVAVGLTQQASGNDSRGDAPHSENLKDGRLSPFSSRSGGTNPVAEEKILSKPYSADSDRDEEDDDYSVEDVYKSVSEKLKKKEDERKTEIRLNLPLDILDENSTSSRHSFSNPGKPSLTPPAYSQTKVFNSDPKPAPYTPQNPPQATKNEYMYSVAESPNLPPSEPFPPPVQHNYSVQVDNPHFKGGQWVGGPPMGGENEWLGNEQWSHGGNQDPYSAASRVGGFPNIPNTYEGGTYNGPQDPYKTVPGPYYNAEQEPRGYMGGAPVDKSYAPPYNANQQPYQSGMYSSQGGPYSYQKPPGQGGYYNNYRQY
ncbi:unnamed protein product, partial [Nezara viridula]